MSKRTEPFHTHHTLRPRNPSGINNVGLMARALVLRDNTNPDEEESAKWQTFHVSTLSIASCIGRILIGILSLPPPSGVLYLHKVQTLHCLGLIADFGNHKGTRRARCLSIVAITFLISQLVGIRVQEIKHLRYAVSLVGISYGGVFALLPSIVIEWFGMRSYIHPFLSKPHSELTFFNLAVRCVQPTFQRTGVSFPYLHS